MMKQTKSVHLFFLALVTLLLFSGFFLPKQWLASPIFQIFFSQLGLLLIPLVTYIYFGGRTLFKSIPHDSIGLDDLIYIILLVIPCLFIGSFLNSVVTYILNIFFGPITQSTYVINQNIPMIVYLIGMALLPAILEETINRGLLFSAYRPKGKLFALISSSLLFSLLHLNLINIPNTFLLGLLFGYLVLTTNSIYSAMIGHFIFNASVLFIQAQSDFSLLADRISISPAELLLMLPSTILFALSGFYLLRRYHKRQEINFEPLSAALHTLVNLFRSDKIFLITVLLCLIASFYMILL